ncbi:MAG: peptidase inhibitor I78 [Brevundimonas sp.]|nr:peptidase inhibitor I78 [Brevundimonas sp.]
MRLILISLAATAALAACAEQTPASSAPADEAPVPAPVEPRPAAPPGPEAPPTPDPADACGAAGRQDWVGRARSDLPTAPAGANWRIYETGQPVTQDLRPDRLNIEIDPDSQTVVRLSCG